MNDLQILVAPLTAIVVGVISAWYFKRRAVRHAEREDDLRSTQEAMVAHFDAMDKIIADEAVPDGFKRSMIAVTSMLGNREFAKSVCETVTNGKSKELKKRDAAKMVSFLEAMEKLRAEHPERIADIETAMSSALFIVMLRWPETARQFKRFAVSSMINEKREMTANFKVSEIAKKDERVASRLDDFVNGNGAYAA